MTQRPPDPSTGAQVSVSCPSLIVIACSSGSLPGLFEVLRGLDRDLPAAIAIVQHRGEQQPHLLIELLAKRTSLDVRHARDGEALQAGVVYVCPPGVHMATEHTIRLFEAPRLRFVRPSADVMLRSAAITHGSRAIGVVLSGAGSDAAAGARALAEAGGRVIVQDPLTCEYPGMASAVIAAGRVDRVLPLADIAAAVRELVARESASVPAPRVATRAATRVLLADDHRIMLEGLRTLLGYETDLEVVAEAHDGRSAVDLAIQLAPDVVVMDIAMPDIDGIAATREIRGRRPRIAVVALSAHTDKVTAERILAAGALGYVCKNDAYGELASAIRTVAARRPYLSRRVAW